MVLSECGDFGNNPAGNRTVITQSAAIHFKTTNRWKTKGKEQKTNQATFWVRVTVYVNQNRVFFYILMANRHENLTPIFATFVVLLTLYFGVLWQAHICIIALSQFLVNSLRNKYHTKDLICILLLFFVFGQDWCSVMWMGLLHELQWLFGRWPHPLSTNFCLELKGDRFVLLNVDCLPVSYALLVYLNTKYRSELCFRIRIIVCQIAVIVMAFDLYKM